MNSLVLQIGPDSISQSRAASKTRYAEACHLEKAGFTVGAIYLFGYSVEIILVATYFEMKGFKKADAIDYNARSRVVHVARQQKVDG